jgi:hypothetical protein
MFTGSTAAMVSEFGMEFSRKIDADENIATPDAKKIKR